MTDNWTLAEALTLIRALQPEVRRFNYHLALGGGVLNRGHSAKDLDLYFLPMAGQGKPTNPTGLMEWLAELWGTGQPISDTDTYGREVDEESYLFKLKFNYSGMRIDVFVL